MLLKANFFLLKKGREPKVPARAPCGFYRSVTAATAAAITIAAALAAATAAAMLVRVPCDPAHTAKHDDCHNDRRQIKVCCQKFHHKASLLSADEAYLFAVILETSILTSLSPTYLLGRNIRYRNAAKITIATMVKKLKPTSPVIRPPIWYTTRAAQ